MHGSAPWKTEETIVGLPRLLVVSVFSRRFSRFGGCHLSTSLGFPGPRRIFGRSTSLITRLFRLRRSLVSWYGRYTRLDGLFGKRVADPGRYRPRPMTACPRLVLSPL